VAPAYFGVEAQVFQIQAFLKTPSTGALAMPPPFEPYDFHVSLPEQRTCPRASRASGSRGTPLALL
jgi:hypothetical protein